MRPAAMCLVLAVALTARGVCVDRPFVPNVPAKTTFLLPGEQTTLGIAAVADFNGDGIADLVISGEAILFGTPSGRMIPRPLVGSTLSLGFAVAADLNGDGKADLIEADANDIGIRLSLGDGTFSAQRIIPYGSAGIDSINALAAGDFNGDGRMDLLIAGGKGLTTYIGHGDGTFTPTATTPISGYLYGLAVGDFDGDGRLDVATVSLFDSKLVVARGKGDGTFTVVQQTTFPSDQLIGLEVVAADFDGDGVPDLAVANVEGIRIMHGAGDGTFRGGLPVPLDWKRWGGPLRLLAADLNRDGLADLVVVAQYAMARFMNFGGGHFGLPEVTPAFPRDVFAADVDGDGWPDLIEVDAAGVVNVLINSCPSLFILRASADAVVSGEPFRLALYDSRGAVSSQATFRDGATVLGSGAGSLTTSLQTAGPHSLTATAAEGTSALKLTVQDRPSSITLIDSKDHSGYGEGIHLNGSVATGTGEAPVFGDVEIAQGTAVVATTPLINGRYDLVFNPLPSTYQLTARYTGAGKWARSDPSMPVMHAVAITPTTMSLDNSTAGRICELRFPPRFNGRWQFSIDVTAPFGTPGGKVTVSIPRLHYTLTQITRFSTFYFDRVPPGDYAFTATYSGDGGYPPSQLAGTITIPSCHPHAAGR